MAELNRVKEERAQVVQRLGWASPSMALGLCASLLERPPECIEGMDVHDLLEACADVGPGHADAFQSACGLFEAVRVGELDAERRAALVALLRFRSPFTRRAA